MPHENPMDICTYSISLCICSLHSLGAQISVPVLRWLSTFSSLAENFYYYNALRKCVQRFRDLPLRFPSELLLLFFPFFLIKHAAIKFQLCLRDWKTIFHSGEHEKLFPKKNLQENCRNLFFKFCTKWCENCSGKIYI